MANKQHVHFVAHKPVKEPAVISFQTKNGPVAFNGHKRKWTMRLLPLMLSSINS